MGGTWEVGATIELWAGGRREDRAEIPRESRALSQAAKAGGSLERTPSSPWRTLSLRHLCPGQPEPWSTAASALVFQGGA